MYWHALCRQWGSSHTHFAAYLSEDPSTWSVFFSYVSKTWGLFCQMVEEKCICYIKTSACRIQIIHPDMVFSRCRRPNLDTASFFLFALFFLGIAVVGYPRILTLIYHPHSCISRNSMSGWHLRTQIGSCAAVADIGPASSLGFIRSASTCSGW